MYKLLIVLFLISCNKSDIKLLNSISIDVNQNLNAYIAANSPEQLLNNIRYINQDQNLSLYIRDDNPYQQCIILFKDFNVNNIVDPHEKIFTMKRNVNSASKIVDLSFQSHKLDIVKSMTIDTLFYDQLIGKMLYDSLRPGYKPIYMQKVIF